MSDPKSGGLEKLTGLVERTTPLIMALGTLITAMASVGALTLGFINSMKINEVHILTNSLATRTEALARTAGQAEGELKGRADQTQERKDEEADKAQQKKPEPKR